MAEITTDRIREMISLCEEAETLGRDFQVGQVNVLPILRELLQARARLATLRDPITGKDCPPGLELGDDSISCPVDASGVCITCFKCWEQYWTTLGGSDE